MPHPTQYIGHFGGGEGAIILRSGIRKPGQVTRSPGRREGLACPQ